ncbi:S-adenosylmethionine-dependent methyltransferase [Schizosaccharomyces cryophilus OY26]|uniref:S-adenosylmethionine-dependent methyltransferase n=1 Tax=Schizosaccharomyces cryophilus (strain OY26 / ATCC MYA-4695 / CBS 11777 / NBRC 106824 / NRRL Y48691) TaxID=653667 RepID=S9VND2_SCHCR|nr:S-adenosylmethionine-dependent methyltransferase [Schizosaccharomyces cryophilus OY26]EPY49453.1 S-adenosylmethionine-dependent methyltransferase [Schizosaccharomyces cryophilus OY26]
MSPSNNSTSQSQRTTCFPHRRPSKSMSLNVTRGTNGLLLVRSYPMKHSKRAYRRTLTRYPTPPASENKENISTVSKASSVNSVKRALAVSEIMNETTVLDLFHIPTLDTAQDITRRVNNELR